MEVVVELYMFRDRSFARLRKDSQVGWEEPILEIALVNLLQLLNTGLTLTIPFMPSCRVG